MSDISQWKGSVVQRLIEQDTISGIGSQLAEEILFRAKIYPNRAMSSLSKKEMEALVSAIHEMPPWISVCGGFWHSRPVMPNGENGYYTPLYKIEEGLKEDEAVKILKVGGRQYHVLCKIDDVLEDDNGVVDNVST